MNIITCKPLSDFASRTVLNLDLSRAEHRWRLPKDSGLRSGRLCTRRDVRATFIFKYRPLCEQKGNLSTISFDPIADLVD